RRSAPCRVWFATTRYLCMTTTTSNLSRPRTALEIERRLRQFPVPASPGYCGLSGSPRRFGAGLGQNARGASPNLCAVLAGGRSGDDHFPGVGGQVLAPCSLLAHALTGMPALRSAIGSVSTGAITIACARGSLRSKREDHHLPQRRGQSSCRPRSR